MAERDDLSAVLEWASSGFDLNQERQLVSTLERLIDVSRSEHGRCTLSLLRAVPLMISVIPQFLVRFVRSDFEGPENLRPLLWLLKLLRNLCAGEAANQDAFLESEGIEAVEIVAQNIISSKKDVVFDDWMTDIIHMSLQLLGNACGGGELHKEATWSRFFPTTFLTLALMRHVRQERVLEPLGMVLYSCCRENKDRLMDLCHGNGAALFGACLRMTSEIDAGGWLHLLVSQICLQQPFLPILFPNLAAISITETSDIDYPKIGAREKYCVEQAVLLEFLCSLLCEKLENGWGKLDGHAEECVQNMPMHAKSLGFIVCIIKNASVFSNPGCTPPRKLPTGIPSIDVLGYAINIIRILTTWECDAAKVSHPSSNHRCCGRKNLSVMDELTTHGIIELCLFLLQELGPPVLVQRETQEEDKIEGIAESSSLSVRNPYEGYRRDIVAIIGNAAYRNRAVQDQVRQKGCLFLVLQQCVVDKENPFLREWALWAVRNLMEGNAMNQKELADIKFLGPSTSQEFVQMGLKVEMDPVTARPRLSNVLPYSIDEESK